jgi:hypothetical protein
MLKVVIAHTLSVGFRGSRFGYWMDVHVAERWLLGRQPIFRPRRALSVGASRI